jgi:hypothetical protein
MIFVLGKSMNCSIGVMDNCNPLVFRLLKRKHCIIMCHQMPCYISGITLEAEKNGFLPMKERNSDGGEGLDIFCAET